MTAVRLKEVFEQLDQPDEWSYDRVEELFTLLHTNVPPDLLKKVFSAADIKGSGFVKINELIEFILAASDSESVPEVVPTRKPALLLNPVEADCHFPEAGTEQFGGATPKTPTSMKTLSFRERETQIGIEVVEDGESANGESGCSDRASTSTPSGSKRKHLSRMLTRQASGHRNNASIIKMFNHGDTDDVPSFIAKKYDPNEARVYEELTKTQDGILRFTAGYCGNLTEEEMQKIQGDVFADSLEIDKDSRYMMLANLMKGFGKGPHVMDCKIGIRSFGEEEVHSTTLRKDLFAKFKVLDPASLTAEEIQNQACTKYRWMCCSDRLSTTQRLGFRVDGIANLFGKVSREKFRSHETVSDIANCIVEHFLPGLVIAAALADDEGHDSEMEAVKEIRRQAVRSILDQLTELREALQSSLFVKRHSLIGTSVLFVVDSHSPRASVHLIDFAKTVILPEGVTVDHISPWTPGNYEDGLLFGADNMLRVWQEVFELVNQ